MSESTSEEPTGARVRFPPPLVPIAALAVGFALDRVFPLAWPALGALRWVLGVGLTLSGFVLLALAMGPFRKTRQNPAPWTASPELIAEGLYRYTRNPMYLGMGVAQAGLATLLASAWGLLLVPITWTVIYVIAIRHEEAYLQERFGEPYRAYCAQVRRWI